MTPRLRPAVRGLVIDHHDHLLLVRLVFPHGAWWVLPGGGIVAGEDHHTALRRELREEVGLHDPSIGPCVWNRVHEFRLVSHDGAESGSGEVFDGQSEAVYLVRTTRFEVAPTMTPDELRAEHLHEHRWWALEDIACYTGPDHFAPPDLHAHARRIVDHGAPVAPIEMHERS